MGDEGCEVYRCVHNWDQPNCKLVFCPLGVLPLSFFHLDAIILQSWSSFPKSTTKVLYLLNYLHHIQKWSCRSNESGLLKAWSQFLPVSLCWQHSSIYVPSIKPSASGTRITGRGSIRAIYRTCEAAGFAAHGWLSAGLKDWTSQVIFWGSYEQHFGP